MPAEPSGIAVVIPTLDEEEALESLLPQLLEWADEVVVSDGGSTDGTREKAVALGVPVVQGPPGRGRQLDLGARSTTAEVLLFLHADTSLPPDARSAIQRAVREGHVGGGFEIRFGGASRLAAVGSRLVNLRSRLTGCPLGDQAQFCTRAIYEELGGFADWPILEDLDMIRRLRKRGRVALLPSPVTTSFRRYGSGGVLQTIATNWLIWGLFFVGVSPRRLGGLYKKIR